MRSLVISLIFVLLSVLPLVAAEHRDIGLTQKGNRIEGAIVTGPSAASPVVLLIGGINGIDDSSRIVVQELDAFEKIPQSRRPFQLIAIPSANPDATRLQF